MYLKGLQKKWSPVLDEEDSLRLKTHIEKGSGVLLENQERAERTGLSG